MAIEFDLPIEIIQHIQSFLSAKQSAQTSIFSKPWFKAWATQPTLRLYQKYFSDSDSHDVVSDEFWNFSRKSLQRYKEMNRKLDKLFLRITVSLPSNCTHFVDEIITDALDLGVNVIRLESCPNNECVYVLPAQVFEANCLTELNVTSCEINRQLVVHGSPFCSRLTSLVLNFVSNSDQIVGDILLGCPLIEILELRFCRDLSVTTTIDVSKLRKLMKLCVSGNDSVRVEFKDLDVGLTTNYGGGRRRNVPEFQYLRKLELSNVKFDRDFFRDFASRFPCIENLYLERLSGFENLQISSHSLRYLSLVECVLEKVRLDVPNVLKLSLGYMIRAPSLSFCTAVASRDWKCCVLLDFKHDVLEDSWFLELKKCLTELRLSRISLRIVFYAECTVSAVEMIPSFPIPVVEDLHLFVFVPPSWNMVSSLLCRLFWTCRPSFISLPKYHDGTTRQLLYEQLILNVNKDLFRMYNLKKVNLELFDDNLKEWQTIHPEEFINVPGITHDSKQIRFRLSWGLNG